MDFNQLIKVVKGAIAPEPYRFGMPQQSGAMTVLPVFGTNNDGRFVGPLSGLKLSQVRGYGNMELSNPSETGIAIVPLHMGYIQDQAQNHALCRSAFIAAGQKLMFEDACCVQQSQGGYLEGREQWFFILPLQLREEALQLRSKKDYSKLWNGISRVNEQFGLASRGHLEQILSRKRAYLTQYQSRLELLPHQTGALFFIQDKLAGVEIAPSAAYFQELWVPLVCFCYGVAAMYEEKDIEVKKPLVPFSACNLGELREQLNQSRLKCQEKVHQWLARTPREQFQVKEEERFMSLRLQTVTGKNFVGQFVEEEGRLVYASLFPRSRYLYQNA